jgi:hypothetical protein
MPNTMSPSDLKALLAAEKADALAAASAAKLSADRADAMDYYLGDMAKHMPAGDGRSTAVSTDVADTIEGLMPSLMEIFAGSDEVVRFEPVGKEDIAAAEQETDYVNHVFMQKNPGFLVLYGFIKDALLCKVGIVKVWWEEKEQTERETYLDQPDETFAMLVADPEIEVVEHTARPISADAAAAGEPAGPGPEDEDQPSRQLHDITVVARRSYACARVEGVPPEEFGIARNARSIRDADYCFHEVLRSESALIAQGFDREQVRALPSCAAPANAEALARDTVNENSGGEGGGDDGINRANRLIRITEHYVRMDYEQNGKAALYRVTTGGDDGELLKRDGAPDVVQVDMIPFAAMTPVIITHRFFGRSIADLVMDIQRIKTALLRAVLDNAYLANNPRVEVAETHTSENTLDDLLVSRPGGIVRTKMPGGVAWQAVPTIGNHVFPLLENADAAREWRTGVSRAGQGLDADALQNQSATAANHLFNAAQARMKLIARIFAETGIRDLFALLHATIRKHGSQPATVRLRNQWVAVDPREWKTRSDLTINVGLGTGGRSERLAHVMAVVGLQKEALAGGMTALVTPKNLYNSAKEVVKLVDLKDVDRFFTDPTASDDPQNPRIAPPPPRPDPLLLELKLKSEIEKLQAQADIETQGRKVQSEIALAERKFELERELKIMEAGFKREAHQQSMAQNVVRGALVRRGPDAEGASAAAPAAEGAGNGAGAQPAPAVDPMPLIAELLTALQRMNAPKRIVRDEAGKPIGIEPVIN